MKKACTLKIALQLRDLTEHAALRDNDTRWSSTYNTMLFAAPLRNRSVFSLVSVWVAQVFGVGLDVVNLR